MLAEKKIQKVIDIVVKNIDIDIDVVDHGAVIVASSMTDHIGKVRPFVKEIVHKGNGVTISHGGYTYTKFLVDRSLIYYLVLEGEGEDINNYCYLIASLFETNLKSLYQKMDKPEMMRREALGQLTEMEFRSMCKEYNIDIVTPICVFVIKANAMQAEDMYNILLKAFPKIQGDILSIIDNSAVMLVKNISEEIDGDDLLQLAAAIEDTILNETSIKPCIGVGTCKNNILYIRESYLEASQAIQVGSIYDANEKIYLYDALILERFLYTVPMETCKEFYEDVATDEFKKILNDEMILTIEKFFENSLNLSETSRQLYIHRNTLVYRLDKIQKVVGLDLRNFHDAVTFKIMMMLERYIQGCCN